MRTINKIEDIQSLVRSGLHFKSILKAVADGSIEQLCDNIPDEFLDGVNEWVKDIQETVNSVKSEVAVAFTAAPKESRK